MTADNAEFIARHHRIVEAASKPERASPKTIMLGVLIILLYFIALVVVAVIDLLYQRTEHMKKMRMTKQELKDEYKQTEGDPHIKARLRQLRQEKARQRMMQAVPEADVVITNPTHYAIALKYDPDTMEAPQCIANLTGRLTKTD